MFHVFEKDGQKLYLVKKKKNKINDSWVIFLKSRFIVDFERHDDDELGFRKNDIITVISQKDEHCWVGELNGLRGWNIKILLIVNYIIV